MKKLFITLAAAMILAGGAFAQSFPDIPEGHWAGDAVERIADLNIVIGFPDGTFRGNEAFTRYQAALVISRMLDVINANMDSAMAMTEEDLASLRNAVQELAADVAAQGVRLSAAEGAIAGLSDDTTANADRIAELEAMLDGMEMQPEIDPAVLRDLQNQVASLRVATDTAQATADTAQAAADAAQATADEALTAAGDAQDAAGAAQSAADAAQQTANGAQETAEVAQATADQANSRANAAFSTAEANASEIAALNDLIQILGDQIEELQAMRGQMDAGTADRLAAVEGDIANIREFVILLRRDQVAIRDRVSALEASDEQQTADIADLQARVTELETNPLGISGSIELEYFVGRADGVGDEFDIDRAYGIGMMRDIGESTFSSGTDEEANADGDDDEVDEPGEYAEDRSDIEYGSDFDADLTINLGAGAELDGEGSPRGLNSFSAVIELSVDDIEDATDATVDDDDIERGYIFTVEDFTATFDPIGAEPLTFSFGDDVDGDFTPYTLNRDGVGFVASVGSPDFLAFVDPSLQVAYLTEDYGGAEGEQVITTGIRGTLSPLDGVTGGFSFVRNAENTADKGDVNEDNLNDTIWGLDAQATLGPVTVAGEYASANIDDGAYEDSILFVQADAMFDILGGVDLSANYRDIADGWEGSLGSGAELTDSDDYTFDEDQAGFGAELGFGLFIFDFGAFVDSYSTDDPDADTFAFGVDASAELFRAFSVSGFYEQVSINDDVVASNDGGAIETERNDEYNTAFGAELAHDGSADNALIPNLNLSFSYEQAYEDVTGEYSETTIAAEADYMLEVSIVTLSPYVSYEMTDNDPANTDETELMVGTGLMTQPLDVFLQPSLEASVNYRQATYSEAEDYEAEQLQWAVGLNLGEFLLPYSSLSARYGSYTGTNVYWDVDGPLDERLSEGDVDRGGVEGQVSGFEVEWNYYDLMFAYGIYDNDPDTSVDDDETGAQAFRVSYEVAF